MKGKPVLKWVGGKQHILTEIFELFPKTLTNYYEPFVGGGSVFIELLNRLENEQIIVTNNIIITDKNKILISVYNMIKTNIKNLTKNLKIYENFYNENIDTREKNYYEIRKRFNAKQNVLDFIILNKTCFRGLYRVNSSGEFNTSFGNYKKINFDTDNIKILHKLFKKYQVEFKAIDYKELLTNEKDQHNDSNTVLYLDPPYYGSYAGYTTDKLDVIFFAQLINKLTSKIVMSNTILVYDYFKENKWKKIKLISRQRINSKNPGNIMKEFLAVSKIITEKF